MAFEQIGVEAVIAGMSTFRRDGAAFNKTIDEMRSGVKAAATEPGLLTKALGFLSGGIGSVATLITGILGARLFASLAQGIAGIAKQAITAAANFQMLEIQITGLLAIQARAASGTEQTIVSGQKMVTLTEEEAAELENLKKGYHVTGQELAVMRQHMEEATTSGKESAEEIGLRSARLAEASLEYQRQGERIAELTARNNVFTDNLVTTRVNQISLNQAMEQSRGPARDLLDWMSDFSIKTTLTTQTVAEMVRGFLSLGMGIPQTQRLTKAIALWGAQMGLTGAELDRINANILQVNRSSKITERDIREFGNAGLNLSLVFDTMAQKLGISRLEAVEFAKDGEAGVRAFTEAIQTAAEQTFPDAIDKIASTWNVAMSNIQELIQNILGREVLGPTLARAGEFISGILDKILAMRGGFRAMGEDLGVFADRIFDALQPVVDILLGDTSLENKFRTLLAMVVGKIRALAPQVGVAMLEWGKQLVEWVVYSTSPLLYRLGELIQRVFAWIVVNSPRITQQLQTWSRAFLDWVGNLIEPLVTQLESEFMPRMNAWLLNTATWFGNMFRTIWVPAWVKWIQSIQVPALTALGEFVGAVTAWLIQTGVQLLIAGLRAAFLVVYDFIVKDPQGINAVTGQNAAVGFVRGFVEGFTRSPLWKEITTFLLFTWLDIQRAAHNAWMDVVNGIRAIIQTFRSKLYVDMIQLRVSLFNAWGDLKFGAIGIWRGMVDSIDKIWDDLHFFVLSTYFNLENQLKLSWSRFRGDVLDLWEGITRPIRDKIDEARRWVEDKVKMIMDFIGSPSRRQEMIQIGTEWIQGLITGLLQKAGSLYSTIVSIVAEAIRRARSSLGIFSPSKKAAKLIGEPVGAGILLPILGAVRAAGVAMGQLAQVGAPASGIANTTSYSTTNNWNLTLNAPVAQDVQQSYSLMRSLAGGSGA